MPDFAPETLHNHLLDRAPRILRFDPEAYFPEWQSSVRRSFKQLLGLMPAKVGLDVQILSDLEKRDPVPHREVRFIFTAEARVQVPCTLVLPLDKPGPYAVMICLQGHNHTARASLGEDAEATEVGFDFAMQALREGYGALALEMRCFGERQDQRPASQRRGYTGTCHHAALVALLLGRTMAGERVWDVSRAIDAMTEHFPEVDASRIAVLGFSGGATIAYYAAAFDARIAGVIAICSVSTYKDSIGTIGHCPDNYIPNILHYFDMADLAGLIVPRPLLIVAGDQDPLFPIAGVRECFAEIGDIYRAQNVAKGCGLVVGAGGHQSYSTLFWPEFAALSGWRK